MENNPYIITKLMSQSKCWHKESFSLRGEVGQHNVRKISEHTILFLKRNLFDKHIQTTKT